MITKYIVGKILDHIFTLVLEDKPTNRERFLQISEDWLTEDQALSLYDFLRSWFYEDINFTELQMHGREESQPYSEISQS